MRSRSQRILLAAISIAAVGGALFYVLGSTATSAFEYYKHVDEIVPDEKAWLGKALELHGFVQPGSVMKRLDRDHQQLEYRFVETNCNQTLHVFYAGTVPDTFKDGAEVVVKGKLAADGFHATEIMAKCPSKYQATAQATPSRMCSRSDSAGK